MSPSSAVRSENGKTWVCFSEATMPDMMTTPETGQQAREDHLSRLAEHGMDMDAVDEQTPDRTLAEMVRVCDSKDDRPPHEMDEDDWESMPDGDEEKKTYAERARKYRERAHKFSCKYDEGYGGKDATELDTQGLAKPGKKEGPAVKMSEVAEVVRREVAAALKADKGGTLGELQRFRDDVLAAEKQRAVEAFCEAQAAAGRLTPAEYRPKAQGGPDGPIFRQLLRADARQKVAKFSERGRVVELTELEAQQRVIGQRATLFGERFRQAPVGAADDREAEVTKLSEHYDQHEPHFRGLLSKQELTETFGAEKKRRPNLTADEFLARKGMTPAR